MRVEIQKPQTLHIVVCISLPKNIVRSVIKPPGIFHRHPLLLALFAVYVILYFLVSVLTIEFTLFSVRRHNMARKQITWPSICPRHQGFVVCVTVDDTTSVTMRPLSSSKKSIFAQLCADGKSNTHFGLKGTHLNCMKCIYCLLRWLSLSLSLCPLQCFPSNDRNAFRFNRMKIIKISMLCCDLFGSLTSTDSSFFYVCSGFRNADGWLCNCALAALTN